MLTVLAFSGSAIGPARAQVRAITLQPPSRDFGYFVGDLLSATATIRVEPGTVLDASALPPVGPAAPSIDITRVQSRQIRGDGSWQLQVTIVYQSFFSPEQVSPANVPGYTIVVVRNGGRRSVQVPGFTFTTSPFRHDLQPVLDAKVLRADHPMVFAQAGTAFIRAAAGGAVALLAALGLLSTRGGLFAARRQRPFARAARDVRRLQAPGAPASREALQLLHRAFDATAGRRVLADDLDLFVTSHPRFWPFRHEIGQFFALSRTVFFGTGADTADLPCGLAGLCRNLARAERMR